MVHLKDCQLYSEQLKVFVLGFRITEYQVSDEHKHEWG